MAKAIKTRNAGTMTEAAYFAKLRSTLRRAFMWWLPMKAALEAAKRKSQSTNKRLKFEYFCCECMNWFPRSQINIDHKTECGSLLCLEDLPQFVKNLTPENSSAFQVLCKQCHQSKTNLERSIRKNANNNNSISSS